MKLRSRLLMTAAGIVLTSSAAQAVDLPPITAAPPPPPPAVAPPPVGGPYVTIFGGLLDIPPVDAEIIFGGGTQLIYVDPDLGFRAGGAIGYAMGNFGVEFEGTYGRVHLGTWDTYPSTGPFTITDPDSNATLISLMGNLNLNLGTGSFRPFVAAGGGAVRLAINDCCAWPDEIVDADWTWGAQVMAGVNVALSDAISIGARYRYQYVGPTSFTDGGADPVEVFGFGTHGFELTLTIGGR